MSEWIKYKIGDLCEVGRGSSPRPINDHRYFEGGNIPWIKIADATASAKYIYKTKEYVNDFGASFSRYLNPESLIIAASGVSLGQIKFLGVKGCIHDGWLYTSDYDKKLSKEFLYYFLIFYSTQFHNFSSGAAIQNINTEILRNTIIPLPRIGIQKKIVSILSAYDDLIENNNQRIQLLEEMASEIYKEWFVRLRFPGYENAVFKDKDGKVVDRESDGAFPDGWRKEQLREHINFYRGKSYSSAELRDNEGLAMINLKNIQRQGGFRLDGLKYFEGKYNINNEAYSGDIVMAVTDMTQEREIVGRVALVPDMGIEKFIISMDLIRIEPVALPKLYLYCFFRYSGIGLQLKEFANGANVLHLTPSLIEFQKAVIPPAAICEKFEELIKPMLSEIDVLNNKNQVLQETRDLLLPRLISGKLSVEHLLNETNEDKGTIRTAAESAAVYETKSIK